MPGAAAAVTREAGHLGLMHGVDHGGGGAGAAQHVADIDHVADASSFAAELARNRDPHEALCARRGDRLGRKARVAIDGGSMFRGDRGDLFCAGGEARGTGRDASRGDLAAHHSARPGNTLQSRRSEMDRCVHNGLIDNPLPPLSPAATGTAKFPIYRDIHRELSRFFRIKVTNRKQFTR